jgi:hypothetical protein
MSGTTTRVDHTNDEILIYSYTPTKHSKLRRTRGAKEWGTTSFITALP